MEIIDRNFKENLDLICLSIRTADFISMTTYYSGVSEEAHEFDSVEDRYKKMKVNCTQMNAFQIGICTFKWDTKMELYSTRPFNALVLPNSEITHDKTI
jgi:poly(A)-specific ribonuclease